MATNTRKDPLPVFAFKVSLNIKGGSSTELFCKSVSGLRYEAEVLPVREGGVNDTTWQLPGAVKWSNIVIKQGFTSGSTLLTWRAAWLSKNMQRASGTIIQLDTALNAQGTWAFDGGWPVKWEVGDYDASKSELQIETLEIAHNGLIYTAAAGT